MAFVECQDVRGLEEPRFEDGDECRLEASFLMEAVVGTGSPEWFSEEGTWRGPCFRDCFAGADVIADGREGEVVFIEGLTERGGGWIIVHVPKVFLVVLSKEAHVVDRRDACLGGSVSPTSWGLSSGGERLARCECWRCSMWCGLAEVQGDYRGHLDGSWACARVSDGGRESKKRAFLKDRGIRVLT